MSETLTESLRRRLNERVACPTCHQPLPGKNVRDMAAEIGLPHTVLWRFLRGGDMQGRNLDIIAGYLEGLGPSS